MGEVKIDIGLVIQGLIGIILGVGVKGLLDLNKNMTKMTTWSEMHEKSDDDRFKALHARIKEVKDDGKVHQASGMI